VAEVEAAVEIGAGRIAGSPNVFQRVIPQLHGEMSVNLAADGRFGERVRGAGAVHHGGRPGPGDRGRGDGE
jgi:hypothetical protein